MSELGGAIAVALGLILIIGGFKGSLLRAAHAIDTAIPAGGNSTTSVSNPGPGAPGSGVTTQ